MQLEFSSEEINIVAQRFKDFFDNLMGEPVCPATSRKVTVFLMDLFKDICWRNGYDIEQLEFKVFFDDSHRLHVDYGNEYTKALWEALLLDYALRV